MRIIEVPRGTVVVGVDGSTHATGAADWAADAARRDHRALTLVHAGDTDAPTTAEPWGAVLTAALARARARHPDLVLHPVEDPADPRLALLELAHHAHLVVVGSRGRGPVLSALLGSVSAAVARSTVRPVVVVRPDTSGATREGVTVVVDRGAPSAVAIELAFDHAAAVRRPLTVVLCLPAGAPDDPTSELLRLETAELCAGMREKYPDVTVRHGVARGPLEDALVAATVTADLTVMARPPRHPATSLVHSNLTDTVLEHACGPVAVVPERNPA